jgi:acetyltransferase-like isoleucine patch superfamily enzyme
MRAMEIRQIHPTALIDEGACVGANVTIGAYAIVHAGVDLGDDSVVGPHCILGEPTMDFYREKPYKSQLLSIGEHALMRSHSVLYASSSIGEHFQSKHRATISEKSKLGHHVRLGTGSEITGDCTVGDYASLHSSVVIGGKSHIGNFVWIFAYSVLTNASHPASADFMGVTIEDFAVIATMVVILPGIHVGRDALIGLSSLVTTDILAEAVVLGSPARQVTTIRDLKDKETGLNTYPLPDHFDRGMPWQEVGSANWSTKRQGKLGSE